MHTLLCFLPNRLLNFDGISWALRPLWHNYLFYKSYIIWNYEHIKAIYGIHNYIHSSCYTFVCWRWVGRRGAWWISFWHLIQSEDSHLAWERLQPNGYGDNYVAWHETVCSKNYWKQQFIGGNLLILPYRNLALFWYLCFVK